MPVLHRNLRLAAKEKIITTLFHLRSNISYSSGQSCKYLPQIVIFLPPTDFTTLNSPPMHSGQHFR